MRVYLANLGCKLNQAEVDRLAREFLGAGHELVGTPEEADLQVVNTCTVTARADASARKAIRRIHGSRPDCPIVVTGCFQTSLWLLRSTM